MTEQNTMQNDINTPGKMTSTHQAKEIRVTI